MQSDDDACDAAAATELFNYPGNSKWAIVI